MKAKIKLRRGAAASVPTLSTGEIGFSTDGKDIYVGSSSGNAKFLNSSKTVTNVKYDSETGKVIKTIDGTDYDAFDLSELAEHDYPGIYNSYYMKDAAGSIVHIKDGADSVPLKAFDFDIEPIQDLHGQANPYPPNGGKNKLPMTLAGIKAVNTSIGSWSGNAYTLNGITYTVNVDNGGNVVSITVNGTAVSSTSQLVLTNNFVVAAGNYVGNGTPSGSSWGAYIDYRNTTQSQDNNDLGSGTSFSVNANDVMRATIYCTVTGTAISNKVFYPMMRLSTEADATFAPYSNECPIGGYTGCAAYVFGRNYQIGSPSFTGYDNANLWQSTSETYNGHEVRSRSYAWSGMSKKQYLKEGVYTFSVMVKGSTSFSCFFFAQGDDTTAKIIPPTTTSASVTTSWQKIAFTFTVTNAGTVRTRIENGGSNTLYVSEYKLEVGPVATFYEPFKGDVYNLTWSDDAGTIYKGHGSYLGSGLWKVRATWASIDMGDITWTKFTWNGARAYYATIDGRANNSDMLSSMFEYIGVRSATYTKACIANEGPQYAQYFDAYDPAYDSAEATAAQFTAAVTGQTLLYELATPIETIVSGPDPLTILGENYIFNDVNDSSLIYRVKPFEDDGTYQNLTAGNAEQLVATQYVEDKVPYNFRTSGGSADIGNRKYETIVGGTLAWNQLSPFIFNQTGRGGWGTNYGSIVRDLQTMIATYSPSSQNTGSAGLYNLDSKVTGHKILLSVDINPTEDAPTRLNGATAVTCTGGQWTHLSSLQSAGSNTISIYSSVSSWGSLDGKTIQYKNIQIFDLTQMFGSAIADYVYSLGHDAAVAWFRKLFPKPYYDYNAGELMSVKTSKHITTGFNQWDEEWEVGAINNNGINYTSSVNIRSKNYIKVIPNVIYHFHFPTWVCYFLYDENKELIRRTPDSRTDYNVLMPDNCRYVRFYTNDAANVTVYKNNFCINISWSGTKDGTYESYEKHEYGLDDDLELRGAAKIDVDNQIYYDGDIYNADGTVTRKIYRDVLNGTGLTWHKHGSGGLASLGAYYAYLPSTWPTPVSANDNSNGKFSKLVTQALSSGDMSGFVGVTGGANVQIRIDSCSDTTALNTYLANNPITVEYPVASPTDESAAPYTSPQVVNDWGTEEYVDTRDIPIPVGHNTKYPANLRDKVQHLMNLAGSDGLYHVQQTGSQLSLTPDTSGGRLTALETKVPNPPQANGTYRLKVVVSDGTPTYSWEAV